uniref:PHB domain-containing protein n=1 Tax=Trichuris muris TaxID=70415 RepID=A0A5S6R2E0_TRIMR
MACQSWLTSAKPTAVDAKDSANGASLHSSPACTLIRTYQKLRGDQRLPSATSPRRRSLGISGGGEPVVIVEWANDRFSRVANGACRYVGHSNWLGVASVVRAFARRLLCRIPTRRQPRRKFLLTTSRLCPCFASVNLSLRMVKPRNDNDYVKPLCQFGRPNTPRRQLVKIHSSRRLPPNADDEPRSERADSNFGRDTAFVPCGDTSMSAKDYCDPYRAAGDNQERFAPSYLGEKEHELGFCHWILIVLSWFLLIATFPISLFFCLTVVKEYERAVIFRLGRLLPGGARGPGIFFVNPCTDTYRKVDLRVVSFDVPPQEILSKDSVTVAVDAVVYSRISNATISVINVEDAMLSTKLLAQTTLRNILGTKTLTEILCDRETISQTMQTSLDEATDPWGVKVERVEVKDVRLPVQLQRAMAAEAEATREARAKAIAADGEQRASKALKEAADIISQSPAALQLRYLQTLTTISAERNSTIIFPFPVDLLSFLLDRQKAATLPTSPTTTYFSTASTFSAPVTQTHSQTAVSPATSPGLSL